MALVVPPIYAPSQTGSLRQGELVSGVVEFKRVIGSGQSTVQTEVKGLIHPYAMVLTQDCDLVWDYQARQEASSAHKLLPNILFCEVMEADSFKQERAEINSSIWQRIKTNKDERYQFLEAIPQTSDLQTNGIPDLCIDFKRYFCVAADDVYWQIANNQVSRHSQLVSPYSEHLVSRFFYFQSRIGLPRDHGRSPV